jgi:hypothetical protein
LLQVFDFDEDEFWEEGEDPDYFEEDYASE